MAHKKQTPQPTHSISCGIYLLRRSVLGIYPKDTIQFCNFMFHKSCILNFSIFTTNHNSPDDTDEAVQPVKPLFQLHKNRGSMTNYRAEDLSDLLPLSYPNIIIL